MIGLDTNVIVRYVAQDDPAQSPAATRLIDSLSSEEPGFLSLVVVAELVWVLQRSYHCERRKISEVLDSLLQIEELVIEQAELVSQALRLYSIGRTDFSDYLIERCSNAAHCKYTFTFDHMAATVAGMRLLS